MRYSILSILVVGWAAAVWGATPDAVVKTAAEPKLTLVKDGTPECVIVTPSWPNEAAVFGAKELQEHIKLITGAEVPVMTDRDAVPAGKIQILVGESRATRKLGLSTKDFKVQEYQIKFLSDSIVLMGRDRTEYPVELAAALLFGPGKFGNAVVDGWACAGVKDHHFNDEQGTMECFIHKSGGTNIVLTGGVILSIGNDQNKQEVRGKETLIYETIANGKSQKIEYDYRSLPEGWHHLMCTWDAKADKAFMYINAKQVGTAPYVKTDCAAAPRFGIRGNSDGVPYCWGPIDEVRLSDIVRKPAVSTKPFETDEATLALLHLDGRDAAWDSSEYPRVSPNEPPRNDTVSTLYAVYDFLEKSCDVQWYFPGEIGRVYPKTRTLTVTGRDERRQPAMACRETTGNRIGGLGPDNDVWGTRMNRVLSDNCDGRQAELCGYRWRVGGTHLYANHSFYGYADRYKIWKANPQDEQLKGHEDEVALFEKGTFMAQGYPEPTQLCYSSPDTIAQIVKDARAYFDTGATKAGANVGANYFALVPADDGFWCKCPKCQAKLLFPNHENANNVPVFFGNGMESNASYLVWDFTRMVANELKKTNPDKYVGQLAYIEYFGYPRDKTGKPLELPGNIVLGSCHGFSAGLVEFDAKKSGEVQIYNEWMKVAKAKKWPTSFWYYECFPNETGGQRGFKNWPGFFSRSLNRVMDIYHGDDVDGLFLCGVSPYIDGWLTFKLMDDPTFNVDLALNKFFKDYYGPAAKPMQAFYNEVQDQYLNPSNYPGGKAITMEYTDWAFKGTPPVMKRLEASMKQAWDTTGEGVDPIYRKRVQLFDDAVWGQIREGYSTWCGKQAGGKHPWPFMIPDGDKFTPSHDAAQSPFPNEGNGVYFRGGAGTIGLRDHRFDDKKGTMEGWVWCGPARTNWCQGPGTLFEINSETPVTGQRVSVELIKGEFVARYDVWNGSVTSRIQSAALKTNSWHQLTARWMASGEKPMRTLHVDGIAAGSKPYKPTACATASAFGIGGRVMTINQQAGPAGFGPIDEIRLSNVLRKPIRQTAPYKTDASTLLLMHFDEPDGGVIKDYSGLER